MGIRTPIAPGIIAVGLVVAAWSGDLSAQLEPVPFAAPGSVSRWLSDVTSGELSDGSETSDETSDDDQPESLPSPSGSSDGDRGRTGFDPLTVSRGQSAFETSCTQCHDAGRALQKQKSLRGWLSTVRRMSRMDDADIGLSNIVPIATYLASLNPAAQSGGDSGSGQGAASDVGTVSIEESSGVANLSGTVSTLFRGGNDNLENPDFFVDAWVRADFQPSGPLRGRVTACTSCHSGERGGTGFTVELVEATAHFDLLHHWKKHGDHHLEGFEAEIKGGRFVVPFGAFAAMSHPGVYRTVTSPLMFIMGRQVNRNRSQPPVIPMPYADEGFDLHTRIPLTCDVNATFDVYAVNGLQGIPSGVDFTLSRSYTDNNSLPAIGGRGTIGTNKFRFGGSAMTGRFQDELTTPLGYNLAGADFTARLFDNDVRLYFEYAIRRNDTIFEAGSISYGTVSQVEVLLWTNPNVSAVARYDNLEHRGMLGETSIERFTWGVNTTVVGGSLLILNHERWRFPTDQPDVDVFGFRWVGTF